MITGNKGEWSELYALVKLLETGRLYAADENVNRIPDVFFPILEILRDKRDDDSYEKEFIISGDTGDITIVIDSQVVATVSRTDAAAMSECLLSGIKTGGSRAFSISEAPGIMDTLHVRKLKASSADKTDITVKIHDIHSGHSPICGFSIKSELGSPPTLLNASGSTNFVFRLPDELTEEQIEEINAIDTRTKIIDRINAIREVGELSYSHMVNTNFSRNLMLIDSRMEEIISVLLLDYYESNIKTCRELTDRIEESNPLGYPDEGFYRFKFKKFLCSVALGMMPAKPWDGNDEANGGYVVVKDDGDVVAYHLYNRNAFESYLLNNTQLERASTGKHGYASIYDEDGKKYINLNLQIRFI